jgi:citrate synthase
MQATRRDVLDELGISDPVLDTARRIEQIALQRRLFRREEALSERRFLFRRHPNAIGFPTEMFTALFALARTVGGSRIGTR